ncbi:MAG: exosortase A [Alphaproteobacteria bacterium]|nr:MAG: exosortase A [Alphaproteobacteria bacterium]
MSTLAIRALGSERSAWRTHLAVLAAVAGAILLLFRRDASDVVSIWTNDSTYNHCFLILPILAWLVAQRLPQLRRLAPAAWWPGLLIAGAGALSWLAGEASGVDLARQLGLLLMLEGSAVAILGKAVTRGLAFPLFYAFFLLPVGSEIVPAMQTATAEIAAVLLALSNVPAHLQGIFITTPTGYFEVAEACAGVKFLIAMLAFAALVANTCYRSWKRRAAFVAVAMAVPVLANGVRAWGTIFIAHWTDISFAEGFDHVFYGFFFFAIVIALILGIGWRFFDRRVGEPWFDPEALQCESFHSARLDRIAPALLALAFAPLAWVSLVAATGTVPLPPQPVVPLVAGWQPVPARGGIPWQPHFAGADRLTIQRYRDSRGRSLDLAIAVFVRQQEGRELVGFGQGAAAPNGRWAWTADAPAPPNGRAERIASHGLERQVVSFYRVGDIVTGSGVGVKIETMKVRLLGGPQRAVALLVSSDSRAAIDDFLRALGPIAPLADRAAGL